jgi:hypothetical protein
MEEILIDILKEKNQINLTDLQKYIPEIKGEYSIYLPTNEGMNKNILLLDGVSKDFIECYNKLLKENVCEMIPVNIIDFLFMGSGVYSLRLFKKNLMYKQTECWQPTAIKIKTI